MRVTVDHVNIQACDRDLSLPIATKDGKLMVNRLIQLLSSYSSEQFTLSPSFFVDLSADYRDLVSKAVQIVFISQDEEIRDRAVNAIYGQNPKEPLAAWADNEVSYALDKILHPDEDAESLSDSTRKNIESSETYNRNLWAEQVLRSRRRISRFNKKYNYVIDEASKLNREELAANILSKIAKNSGYDPDRVLSDYLSRKAANS